MAQSMRRVAELRNTAEGKSAGVTDLEDWNMTDEDRYMLAEAYINAIEKHLERSFKSHTERELKFARALSTELLVRIFYHIAKKLVHILTFSENEAN